MAAITIGAPGTRTGPCISKCKHVDCELSRETAKALCFYCQKVIGYEQPFYGTRVEPGHVGEDVYYHERCKEEQYQLALEGT